MDGKICLVTGANSGIGKETTRELAARGATVIMVCRDREKGMAALGEIAGSTGNGRLDLQIADLAQVRSLGERICSAYPRLDVLINNAGLQLWHRQVTPDGHETTFAVNQLAPFLLTHLLLEPLKAAGAARIINVASGLHKLARMNFDNLMFEGRYSSTKAYAQSKLAIVMFTYELARRLAGAGITANAVMPGVARTGFTRDYQGLMGFGTRLIRVFMITPQRGAETPVYLATSPEVEGVTGKYFEKMKVRKSSAASYDTAVARRLWQVSAELTGLDHQKLPEAAE
ncbi:MAG: SDR family oxidoreductase [Candidatus Neomarinimicrobiota bacterium]